MIVTIDGPAGVGKSTAARKLAASLGIAFLDTGATYRAVTLKALRDGVDLIDADALVAAARSADIRLAVEGDALTVLLDGQDVTDAIRTAEVSNSAHFVANCPSCRDVLVDLQRRIGAELGEFVAEGRDQGSVVFPEADVKFFFDADSRIRAERRQGDLAAAGEPADLDAVQADIEQRDHRDRTRDVAPLVRPEGAVDVDTSDKTIEQVHAELLAVVETRRCR
ncbi:MAG: (d)CMP kinase [Planctomycetota bacterium]|jgi:cytidylate kinase